MAEFLSLQEGKVYRPSASRLARWIDSARNDFYAKAFEFVNPQRVATGTYLYDIVAMWLPSEGLHVGHIIRIIRSPSLQSHYPVFEWRTDTKAKEKITMCVRVLDFKKVKEDQWELSTTENFKWCSVRSILKVVGAVDDGKWPIHVDLSQVVEQVPALKEMDKEREAREEILKKKERELRKEGSADDMTVTLLREVLDELNVTYRKNEKKAELVRKVKEARSVTIDATQDCDSGSENTTKSSKKTLKLKWPIPYYYDEKRNVFIIFCCIFYFF